MKNVFKVFFLFLIEISLISISIFFDFDKEDEKPESYFLDIDDSWADTLLKKMTLDEKIGQLFVLELVEANSEEKGQYDSIIQQFSIGAIKFQKTEVLHQLIITNYLQAKSKHPLLVGSEGSIMNRSNFNLPIGPIINSIKDERFIDFYFAQFSEALKLEGVNFEFSNSIERLDSLGTNKGFSDFDSISIEQSASFRKKLHHENVISCLNFNPELFFLPDSISTDSIKLEN